MLSADGFDRADMKPRTMRLADAEKAVLERLQDATNVAMSWRKTDRGRFQGSMRVFEDLNETSAIPLEVAFDVKILFNKHPNGTATGLSFQIRLSEKSLTLEEMYDINIRIAPFLPALADLEADFCDVRVWE